ncbi:periplasmic thioredoxin of cytochrome c-type biogenesis [Rubrivivax sp. A210]|uniref:DsbE family thiol:disulfide interchange protein n=1 Tax=Rubrivivax sp. A210 TaxID=2772301 RepID=UPI00191B53E8|nr:DsbE family thiol:disulfide interchange protein [Rubrivivax sp. A210]CAD5374425.1 periplasmic thioredoxin of cytochrome c-type biogenesis [Rubrivivax sp. A210]
MTRFLWPLILFIVLAAFLAFGLRLDPREVPSPLIDKPAPAFSASLLSNPAQTLKPQDMAGKVWMLNVWASWCVACRAEHPVLVRFAQRGVVPIYGLQYKDERKAGLDWLQRLGNPYTDSVIDADGRIGIDYGVYGVPETFVIDRQGVIRYKHIGPVTEEVLRDRIEPLVRKLNA